jgi:hypothetical protein
MMILLKCYDMLVFLLFINRISISYAKCVKFAFKFKNILKIYLHFISLFFFNATFINKL